MQDKVIKAIRESQLQKARKLDRFAIVSIRIWMDPFNRDLATALQPLRTLLQKNAQPFHINDEQTLAF